MLKQLIEFYIMLFKEVFSIDFILFFSALYFIVHIIIAISRDFNLL